jgi:hypothetical protein
MSSITQSFVKRSYVEFRPAIVIGLQYTSSLNTQHKECTDDPSSTHYACGYLLGHGEKEGAAEVRERPLLWEVIAERTYMGMPPATIRLVS